MQPEAIWKSQSEDQTMQITITNEQLCASARSRERLNTVVLRTFLIAMAVLIAGLFYNLFRLDQPWIRFGQAWTAAIIVYIFAPALHREKKQEDAGAPCALFLERQLGEMRRSYLRIRDGVYLFIPGIAACWWGGQVRHASLWPFLVVSAALISVWRAFGAAAEKAARELEEIRRGIR